MSFVWGEKNVEYLRKRFEVLKNSPQFAGMEYSEDPAILTQWMPLVMEGRDPNQKCAGTRVAHGTDVNFGALARGLIKHLQQDENFHLLLSHEVIDLERQADGTWLVTLQRSDTKAKSQYTANFVFLGAGGARYPCKNPESQKKKAMAAFLSVVNG